MANSCPFVALQTCCQMAAVLKSCTVCRGNDSLQAYGLLEILKRILFQGSQTFIEQCLKTGSVLDLWFRVFIFMRNVSNRCSFGKRDLSLDSIFFFFFNFLISCVYNQGIFCPTKNTVLAVLSYCVLY